MKDWSDLKKLTQARIGIGRTGASLPTKEHLQFQLDHALARDAVHLPWKREEFAAKMKTKGMKTITLESAAGSRLEYLKRPDLGRALEKTSRTKVNPRKSKVDLAIIVSNGLSSAAVHEHALPFLSRLTKALRETGHSLSPLYLVENARVAISDEIGALAKAKLVLMILGERPGLTSSDSLAVYLTYAPKPGNTDAKRNCISNIRPPNGLSYEVGIAKTLFLTHEALRRKLSGVDLKDETPLLVGTPGSKLAID